MKVFTVVAGACAVVAYAVWGMLVINNLGLVAGSGLPLEETLSAMVEAREPASMVQGYVLVVVGIAAATYWAIDSIRDARRGALVVLTGWCAALVLGAPFLFFSGFWNLNSLGDTFFDWDMEAVAALERPLYLTSGLALVVLVALGVWQLVRRARGIDPPLTRQVVVRATRR
jgi:hypothetical protein